MRLLFLLKMLSVKDFRGFLKRKSWEFLGSNKMLVFVLIQIQFRC